MRNRYLIIIVVFAACHVGTLPCSAGDVLTWQVCVGEALQKHPDLISAAEAVNQAAADKTITQSGFLPQLSAQASGTTAKNTSGSTNDSYSYGLSATQLLFDGAKLSSETAAAVETYKAAMFAYDVTSSDLRFGLRSAFVQLLRGQRLVIISEEIAQRRQQNLRLVELRYEAGREHKGALLTARADFSQADFDVAQAKRNLSLCQRRLVRALGREENTPVTVEGEFVVDDKAQPMPSFEVLAETTPLLQELIAQKEAARQGVKSARAEFFPEIYASGSLGKSGSAFLPKDDEWSAGLSISLPVFEGGSRVAQYKKARAAYSQAQADARSGRDEVVFTLQQTWTDFQDALEQAEVSKQFLEAIEERAKIAQAQYSNGLITFDDWTIIEDDLASARTSYLDATANALVTQAYWIQAKGGTLTYVQK